MQYDSNKVFRVPLDEYYPTMDTYEVQSPLGSGSFGNVHKIRRKADGKQLVWKELFYGGMSEREKSMLVSEVNILRALKHPNIVRYYDRIIVRETSKIYIVMEYCENRDLAALLKKHKRACTRFDEFEIWNILFHVASAIQVCHSRPLKILHRDLKPANVFIDKHNTAKVGDFGLAREMGKDSFFAHTNAGTPFYMSPEQIDECPYNEKVDMWSLGCLLHEMCVLAPPFDATNQLALALKIKAGRYNRIPSQYSVGLQSAINGLLQIDTSKRWTIDELLKVPEIAIRRREQSVSQREQSVLQREQSVSKREQSVSQLGKQKEAELSTREVKEAKEATGADLEARPSKAGFGLSEPTRDVDVVRVVCKRDTNPVAVRRRFTNPFLPLTPLVVDNDDMHSVHSAE